MNLKIQDINTQLSNCKNYIQEYKVGQSTKLAQHLKDIVEEKLPQAIREYISNENYKVEGSIGKGRLTETLWIGVFNKAITNSATKGVYLVFLFSKDLQHVYLTLIQAASEMNSRNTSSLSKYDKRRLSVETSKIRSEMQKVIPQNYIPFLGGPDNINTSKKDYALGCIFGNEWDMTGDSEELADLFNAYLDIYEIYYRKLYKENHVKTSTPVHVNKTDVNENLENEVKPQKKLTMIESFITALKESGLIFSDNLIRRFISALEAKPFVILSGLAGSGKTQLALAFSRWITKDNSQVCIVPVQSDWTNREPLLGFPDALDKNNFVADEPAGSVIKLIEAANNNVNKPYFLILDEMNLSYVERYFADFLSSIESGEPIKLWKRPNDSNSKVPDQIFLSPNLFIIGTMNVDETTYMFSPKVLDRANVIEFKADAESIQEFLEKGSHVDKDKLNENRGDFGVDFMSKAVLPVSKEAQDHQVIIDLINFFKSLKKVNAEFGFRTASEINRYINLAKENRLDTNDAVDSAILQKLLPKLHGSRKKLTPVLSALWNLCLNDGIDSELLNLETQEDFKGNSGEKSLFKYPLTAEKIFRMYSSVVDNGFTSFAEA